MGAAPSDVVALGAAVRRETVGRVGPDVEPATTLPFADAVVENEGPVLLGTGAVTPPAPTWDAVAHMTPDEPTAAVGDCS